MRMRPAQRLWPEYEDGKMQPTATKMQLRLLQARIPGVPTWVPALPRLCGPGQVTAPPQLLSSSPVRFRY